MGNRVAEESKPATLALAPGFSSQSQSGTAKDAKKREVKTFPFAAHFGSLTAA